PPSVLIREKFPSPCNVSLPSTANAGTDAFVLSVANRLVERPFRLRQATDSGYFFSSTCFNPPPCEVMMRRTLSFSTETSRSGSSDWTSVPVVRAEMATPSDGRVAVDGFVLTVVWLVAVASWFSGGIGIGGYKRFTSQLQPIMRAKETARMIMAL